MKKIVKLHWENYKQSEKGKESIASFEKLTDSNTSIKDLYKLACKYNPEFFKNTSIKEEGYLLKFLDYLDNTIGKLKEDIDKQNQIRVYHHDKNGVFNEEKCTETYRWEEMENSERFNELKRMLSK